MNLVELASLDAVVGETVESMDVSILSPDQKAGAAEEARRIFRRDALTMAGPASSAAFASGRRARIYARLYVDRTVSWHCVFISARGTPLPKDQPFAIKAGLLRVLAQAL